MNAPILFNIPFLTHSISGMGSLILLLILLQTAFIIGLQRSRMSNKRARNALRESQKALEQRITERTESLHLTNNLLIDEVARHEQTGRQLRETKQYLQSIINSMPSIIIGITENAEVTHWNAAAENCFEIFSQDALDKKITSLLPHFPINTQIINSAISEGEPITAQHVEHLAGEKKRYFDLTIYPLISRTQQGAVIRIDDVTLKVTVENLMIQNEKMFSLGEVAAGIAHEINNPLSIILQNSQNIIRRTDPFLAMNQARAEQLNIDLQAVHNYLKASEVPAMIDSIRDAGERSASIVRNMLEFSHNSKRNLSIVDIRRLIDHTLVLSRSTQNNAENKPICITTEFHEPLPALQASAAELQQVLLNLLRNAAQALTEHRSETPCIQIKVYGENNNLVIEIQDNGPGMADTIREHIFDPFFTTKEVGYGTGLGLSISYFIITERHKGSIDVKSSPGKGSNFIIKLPVHDPRQPCFQATQKKLTNA